MAAEVVEGSRLLKEHPELKPSTGQIRDAATEIYGELFSAAPEVQRSFVDAATAVYARDRLISGELEFDHGDYEAALKKVAGEPFEYNDHRILPPTPGMSEDDFEGLMETFTDADLIEFGNGEPIHGDGSAFTADELEGGFFTDAAHLVTSSFGRYLIQTPDGGFVLTEDGGPYELNLSNLVGER